MKKTIFGILCFLFLGHLQGQKFGINAIVNNQVKAFPQVVDDYVYIQLPKQLLDDGPKLEIHNADGKLVATARLSGTVCAISMADLPTGTYQLNVSWAGGSAQLLVRKNFVW